MTSLLDPLPGEVQQIVEIVAEAYSWNGHWPVWQFVAQQAYGKFGIDADAALRNQPQWQWPQWTTRYQAIRTVPAVVGNSLPDIEARTVLTAYGLFHASKEAGHLLLKAIRALFPLIPVNLLAIRRTARRAQRGPRQHRLGKAVRQQRPAAIY